MTTANQALALRRLEVGEQIDTAVRVWRRDFGKFSLIAMVSTIPVALITFFYQSGAVVAINSRGQLLVRDVDAYESTVWLFVALSLLVTVFTYGTLFHAMTRSRLLKPWSLGDSMKGSLRRYFPFLALGVVYGLVVVAGLFALIVPGVVLAISLSIAAPGFWAEGSGPLRSIRRAWQLVSGLRGKVFAVLLVAIIVEAALGFWLLPLLATEVGTDNKTMFLFVNSVVVPALSGLLTPLVPAVLTVAYYDARVRKEGFDLQLAAESLPGPGTPASE